jgi:hypothetical protein
MCPVRLLYKNHVGRQIFYFWIVQKNKSILTSYTGDKSIAARTRRTGALRLMATGRAHGALGTRAWLAHRAAGLTQEVAGLVVATIVINPALHAHARHQRAALQTRRAHAAGGMEFHAAFSTSSTWRRRRQAGVDAILRHTGLVQRTVVVGAALGAVALSVGVAAVALRTGANRVVGPGRALGLGRARILHQAGVDAALVEAGLILCALGIRAAFWSSFN